MLLENNPYPADVRVRSEARSLTAHGYDVTVIAPLAAGQLRREIVAGVRVQRFRLPRTPQGKLGFVAEYIVANIQLYARGARELLRGAGVLHLHNPPDTLFGVAFLARAMGREVVFDHHDLFPELFAMKFGDSRLMRLLLICERLTFRAAKLVLAANESHREVALTRGGRAPEQVVVVRNGPPAAALVARSPARGGKLEDPHLLFLGSVEPQDGVGELPALMRMLAERHGLGGAHLTVVGDGSARASLEQTFRRSGLADRVRFTGLVEHEAVPALIAEADICIDPAGCSELNHRSTMIKIAEYMAAARPIVAYPLIETRRTAGEAALYARCDDLDAFTECVARLVAEPALRAELAELGRRRVAGLTWDRSEQALLEAYARLGDGRR